MDFEKIFAVFIKTLEEQEHVKIAYELAQKEEEEEKGLSL